MNNVYELEKKIAEVIPSVMGELVESAIRVNIDDGMDVAVERSIILKLDFIIEGGSPIKDLAKYITKFDLLKNNDPIKKVVKDVLHANYLMSGGMSIEACVYRGLQECTCD